MCSSVVLCLVYARCPRGKKEMRVVLWAAAAAAAAGGDFSFSPSPS